jgi:hypothetical protein
LHENKKVIEERGPPRKSSRITEDWERCTAVQAAAVVQMLQQTLTIGRSARAKRIPLQYIFFITVRSLSTISILIYTDELWLKFRGKAS